MGIGWKPTNRRRPFFVAGTVSENINTYNCVPVMNMKNNPIRPYDKELMELLFLLEAAEKSEKGGWENIERELGWENLERELAWRENLGSKDNLRGEGVNMFNKEEWKDKKEEMDVWTQQPMLSNQVLGFLVSTS